MKNWFLWFLIGCAAILSIILILQVNYLFFSSNKEMAKTNPIKKISSSFSKESSDILLDIPSLALKSEEEITTLLGSPERTLTGKLSSGKKYKEYVYEKESIMITFVENAACRFSVEMKKNFYFPHDAEEALKTVNLYSSDLPEVETDLFLKWEHSIKDYELVSVMSKDNYVDYVNVIIQ